MGKRVRIIHAYRLSHAFPSQRNFTPTNPEFMMDQTFDAIAASHFLEVLHHCTSRSSNRLEI